MPTTPSDPGGTVEAHLPLTPMAFEILLALSDDGARHGYAIMRAMEDRSDGTLSVHAGTLYRGLARLVEAGLLEELDEAPEPEVDERRRYYRLTGLGRRVAAAEARRLASQVGSARAFGLLGGGETG